MPLTYVRVVNEQVLPRSVLLDKIDRSQGNFEGYAQHPKQGVYVPYLNPNDAAVKGYLNLVPADEVLLSANNGSIKGLSDHGYVTFAAVDYATIKQSTVTSAIHTAGGSNWTVIDGTTFTSIYPDVTRLQIKNLAGVVQIIPSGSFNAFSGTSIKILDAVVTIGIPGVGWEVRVQANSLFSGWFTL